MGGGGTNTTTQNADPWWGQQPALLQGYQGAMDYLGNEQNRAPAFVSADTRQALSDMSGFGASPNMQTARNTGVNLAANGFTDPNAMAGLTSMAGQGSYGDQTGTAVTNAFAANGAIDEQGFNYLQRAAGGEFLTQQNPYFQSMVDQNIAAARPSMDAAFASTGRMGSGAQAAAFADAALRQSNELGYADYSRERGLQDSAARGLLDYRQADAGMRLGAAGALNAGARSDAATRAGLLSGLNSSVLSRDQARLGAAQAIPNLEMAGVQSQLGAGQAQDQMAQTDRDAYLRVLQNYAGLIGGNPGSATTSKSPAPDQTGAYVGAGVTAAATIAAAYI